MPCNELLPMAQYQLPETPGRVNTVTNQTVNMHHKPEEQQQQTTNQVIPRNDDEEEEDVVATTIGNYGKWQLLLTFLLSLFNIPCTWHIFLPTFYAASRDYWCSAPPHLSHLDPQIWREYSQPKDSCTILDLPWDNITATDIINGTAPNASLIPCQHWTWINGPEDDQIDGETIVSEWTLVCDREYLLGVAETAFLGGVALGGLVSGMLSDRYGRRNTLAVSCVIQTTIGTLIAFMPWYEAFVTLRAILGFFSVAVVFCGFVLSLEVVGGIWRTVAGVSYLFPVSISYAIISGIAYLLKGNWRRLQLAATLPPAILLLTLWYPITESPRWLLAVGKKKEYEKVIESACKFNNLPVPVDQSINNIQKTKLEKIETPEEESAGLIDLFRTSQMRKKTFCLFIIWFSVYFVYYGLVLNVGNFIGDLYINAALSGLVEIPALAASILFLMKIGRRWPLCITMIVSGFACIAALGVPANSNVQWVSTALAMLGKLCISSSNAVMPVFTAELYPTVIRNLGVGASNVSAGIALMLVPHFWSLSQIHSCLPMTVLGLCGIIGGVVVLLLPETGNKPLSGTIKEEEEHEQHNHHR